MHYRRYRPLSGPLQTSMHTSKPLPKAQTRVKQKMPYRMRRVGEGETPRAARGSEAGVDGRVVVEVPRPELLLVDLPRPHRPLHSFAGGWKGEERHRRYFRTRKIDKP